MFAFVFTRHYHFSFSYLIQRWCTILDGFPLELMTDCVMGEQKLLSELRVTELKQELEKRNLDKNGIKIILTDRLEKVWHTSSEKK
ncbi:hypothetical protein Y032_0105g3679 [Ancylostoma ceylanicum]|uniref:SAP domain-containing protein n=1 Tax=Ancylostoma ceylanicum TaxID=53326 RepID=A0A016TG32_9BILA|nr:hypothetical protein Y032_0105g3679 [Ancylostoma ceylanicum]